MALKRITEKIEYRPLGHVRLWLDDLQAMVGSIREVSPDIEMLVNDDYQIDRIDDLVSLDPPNVKSFVLRTKQSETSQQGGVTLELSRAKALLTLTNPRKETMGMATYIERRVKDRRRPIFASRRKIATLVTGGVVVALGLWPFTLDSPARWEKGSAVASILALPAVMLMVLIGLLPSGRGEFFRVSSAVIIPRTRADAPPWLQRNKDALVTNAIVSAVFLILGILIGYMLPKTG